MMVDDLRYPPPGITCKGAWSLGTACGRCERCLRSAPDEIRRLRAEITLEQQWTKAWQKTATDLLRKQAER